MDEASSPPVTQLLQAWSAGDEEALALLMPEVYAELRRIAHRRMSLEKPGNSLQPTALVNEVYLRLVDTSGVSFRDRSQFFALVAQMMRRILVDAARARGTSKRGGAVAKISFEEGFFAMPAKDREIVALDDALQALAKEDPRKARAVELRFFGGLSIEETAEVLGISVQTVRRDWNFAQAWLARAIGRRNTIATRDPRPRRRVRLLSTAGYDPDHGQARELTCFQFRSGELMGRIGLGDPGALQNAAVVAAGETSGCAQRHLLFGAVLYEMVTGKRAFHKDSMLATIAAVLHEEPDPLPLSVPIDLQKVILRCLKKDPERRFQTMADLRVALEELREESLTGSLYGAGNSSLLQSKVAEKRAGGSSGGSGRDPDCLGNARAPSFTGDRSTSHGQVHHHTQATGEGRRH